MVPPRTNRTNRDPYGWRCPEGITALPRNCHVSATARKNLAQSGTQPGGEMYRRRVASDQSRVAQLKYQHLRASTKACQEFSGFGQYPPHFKKPHWQIRRHGKWMSASFPGKDNIGWPDHVGNAQYRKSRSNASIMAEGQSSFIGGAGLRRSSLLGLGAGCPGFRRHDGNRKHELCSLAVDERAPVRGYRLDLRLLDGTQLRCRCKRSSPVENRHGCDRGRSQENLRPVAVAGVSERRLDHLS
jgi:hypothetical protein